MRRLQAALSKRRLQAAPAGELASGALVIIMIMIRIITILSIGALASAPLRVACKRPYEGTLWLLLFVIIIAIIISSVTIIMGLVECRLPTAEARC